LDQAGEGALILRVHPGNFQQVGFVERPSLPELAELAQRRGVLLLKDLGGGALVDLAPTGFVGEPLAPAVVASGVDVVTFSTDKVLGGPQGGVAAGKRSLIEKLRSHPLQRALRLGRLPTVALEATLEAYLRGAAFTEVPALSLIATPVEQLAARVQGWTQALAEFDELVSAVPTLTEMGGGSLAGRTIASAGLRLRGTVFSADELLSTLRRGKPAVLGRIQEDAVILDARTVFPRQDEQLVLALRSALRQVSRLTDQR
jgi:L-seryl-tRNA(Ser) seleniumtransferase